MITLSYISKMTKKNKKGKKKSSVKDAEKEKEAESLLTPCLLCGQEGAVCVPCKEVELCADCSPRHKHRGRCLPWSVTEEEAGLKVRI